MTTTEHSTILLAGGTVDLVASATGGSKKPTRFRLVGYTGAAMNVGWGTAAVIDLAGLDVGDGILPILLDHENNLDAVFGQSDAIKKENGQLIATGIVFESVENERVAKAVKLAKSGLRLQASVGTANQEVLYYGEDETVEVNGQSITGPVYVVSKSTLREISVVVLGADGNTSTSLAAKNKGTNMPKTVEPEVEPKVDPVIAERARVAAIRAAFKGKFPEVERRAVDDGWDLDRVNASLVQLLQATPPPCNSPEVFHASMERAAGSRANLTDRLLARMGRGDPNKPVKEEPMSLADMCAETLRAGGYPVPQGKEALVKAALQMPPVIAPYRAGEDPLYRELHIQAHGTSTMTMPEVFGNVMNRVLVDTYREAPSTWREVFKQESASDFRDTKGVRAQAMRNFEEVGPKGELKHDHLTDEMVFLYSVETFGRIFGVSRHDIVNDDLGVFDSIPRSLALAGARTLNDHVWGEFLKGMDKFFSTDHENLLNGSNSDMNCESLAAAIRKLRTMRDQDGNDLDIVPAVLLVPPALETIARQILESTELQYIGGAADAVSGMPTANSLRNSLKLVVEPRLANTQKFKNASDSHWFVMARPATSPVGVVGFLNGRDVPVVEPLGMDQGDMLAYRWRCYHDFGFAFADWRCGVRCTGK